MKKEYIEPKVRVQEIMGSELMNTASMNVTSSETVDGSSALGKQSYYDEFDEEEEDY